MNFFAEEILFSTPFLPLTTSLFYSSVEILSTARWDVAWCMNHWIKPIWSLSLLSWDFVFFLTDLVAAAGQRGFLMALETAGDRCGAPWTLWAHCLSGHFRGSWVSSWFWVLSYLCQVPDLVGFPVSFPICLELLVPCREQPVTTAVSHLSGRSLQFSFFGVCGFSPFLSPWFHVGNWSWCPQDLFWARMQ